jgi:hypothetical protein
MTTRAGDAARAIADRHYNRQKVGAQQFVPPGRCLVLISDAGAALWVTSWPLREYVKHRWAGAWVNSLFRNEGDGRASDLIIDAVAATRAHWKHVPEQGMITFVDPRHVRPTRVRGREIFGYCYMKAGFQHVGFTEDLGLWAWQLLPENMPEPVAPVGGQQALFA